MLYAKYMLKKYIFEYFHLNIQSFLSLENVFTFFGDL